MSQTPLRWGRNCAIWEQLYLYYIFVVHFIMFVVNYNINFVNVILIIAYKPCHIRDMSVNEIQSFSRDLVTLQKANYVESKDIFSL